MRIKVSEITPLRIYEAIIRRLLDLPDRVAWYLSGYSKRNKELLKKYNEIHKGKRCFIIANGPSLKKMDLSVLSDQFTISMNRAYLMYDDWGFVPSYYICINELVIEQFAKDIFKLNMPKFLNYNRRDYFPYKMNNKRLMFTRYGFGLSDDFQNDITKTMSSGGTVTYAALQLAYYMGFEEVIIIGMDHNFVEKGLPNKTEVRKSKTDESHCHPDYFPQGIKWQLPDLYRSELAYSLARKSFENDGRKVVDATVGGKCDVFQKVEFNSLFT